MQRDDERVETPNVDALVSAWRAGALSRREFLNRAGSLGLGAAAAGALLAAAPRPLAAQTTQKRELVVGQDFSIGYLDHTATAVHLYIQESLTFRVLTAGAAVPLVYGEAKGKRQPR